MRCDPTSWHGMPTLATESKQHISQRSQDLVRGSGPVAAEAVALALQGGCRPQVRRWRDVEVLSREMNVPVAKLAQWSDHFLSRSEGALTERERRPQVCVTCSG